MMNVSAVLYTMKVTLSDIMTLKNAGINFETAKSKTEELYFTAKSSSVSTSETCLCIKPDGKLIITSACSLDVNQLTAMTDFIRKYVGKH